MYERKLNLEQQKKRAKERARKHGCTLSEAQREIARELGLASWPRLVAHIAGMDRLRAAIASGAAAPDNRSTLHIRCGSDIREPLERAGFVGDFLEFSDPLCQGPVPREGDLVRIRAHFLAHEFPVPEAVIAADYRRTLEQLAAAPTKYARVVLWLEHDSYDQLILARLLAELPTSELICIDRFPAVTRFEGLGQLSPVALRLLWESRARVTAAQARLGTAVWSALREPSPMALHAIAAGGTPELPIMAPALLRHLQELPWTLDGLSLTQRLILEELAHGPLEKAALFNATRKREPLPYLGDGMFYAELRLLKKAIGDGKLLALTAAGKSLLAGELDWLKLKPPERWVGGVRRGWRWNGIHPVPER